MNKRAILIVSFGSSYKQARVSGIQPVEAAIEQEFQEYDIVRAYTSNTIRAKLQKEGIEIDSPFDALKKLVNAGYNEIYVQSLHILAGFEYDKIQEAVAAHTSLKCNIILGGPLMATERDVHEVVEALKNQMAMVERDKKVILVGHGTDHAANRMYQCLEEKFQEASLPVIVGTIEAGVDEVINRILGETSSEYILMPFLLVAGEHVINDLMGDDKDSWLFKMQEAGFQTSVYHKGIGENHMIQQLYVKRLMQVFKEGVVA